MVTFPVLNNIKNERSKKDNGFKKSKKSKVSIEHIAIFLSEYISQGDGDELIQG